MDQCQFYQIDSLFYLLLNSLQLSMNYKQSQLKAKLIREAVGDTVLYYSLVKKEGKNLTFLSNERLLIYDSNRRILFYNNDYSKTPFRTVVPEPKNNIFSPLLNSTFSNPNSTNNILVRCTTKNQKGELQTIEWNFTCDSKTLADEWMKLLQDEKNKIIEKGTGEKNAGFIHDTLLQAMKVNRSEEPAKETILKPEEQVIKPVPVPVENSDIRNSRLSQPRKSQILSSNVQPVNNTQSNIRKSEIRPIDQSRKQNIGNSSIKPRESNINSNVKIDDSLNNSNLRSSYNKPSDNLNQTNKERSSADWNFKFLKLPTEATIYEFELAAVNALMAIWQKDSGSLTNRRIYESQGLKVVVTNCFTKESTLLKREFRNYHFIFEACKNKIVVGVPLTCLIQWQGVVALVKAPIPLEAQEVGFSKVAPQVRELQRYTRVSNMILEKAYLWDLTDIYGLNNEKRFIYVDGLIEYLPIHPDQSLLGSSLRPQYLLDTVDHVIPGGDARSNRQQQKSLISAIQPIDGCIKQLTQFLNSQDLLWADALELKEIFHSFGVNFKFLPQVYESVGNKNVRKYMQSVMTAKVAKDIAYSSILEARKQSKKVSAQRIVQDYIRLLMQGNNHNSSEAWKQLNLSFKKQFSSPISNSQIIPGFFLNSFLKLLRVKVDTTKLNKTKKAFKEQGIIGVGFITDFDPKVKSYYRFTTQFIQKVRYACRQQKKDQKIHEQIINELQLSTKKIPAQYKLNNNDQAILEYLSYYTAPAEFQSSSSLKHLKIYQSMLQEPPSAFSLRITKSYLTWAVKKEKNEEFKQFIEEALRISDYWLEDGHLYQADLIELLSDYYAAQGNTQQSLNYLKQALSKTIKSCGSQSRQAGSRYYQLGQRQLKAGNKKEAMDSFSKAKTNLLANKSSSINYPLLLMRTASLQLNNGNMETCVETALDAIKNFDQYDRRTGSPVLTEGYKIKTFEILARAYEINNRTAELRSMATICAKKFNSCVMDWTFEQMLRICLGAAYYTHTNQQCQIFYQLCMELQKEEEPLEPNQAIKQLMGLAQSITIMDKFLSKFDYVEKILADKSSKKPLPQETRDFLLISRCVAAVVGEDYIEGLIQQKQYE